jgi:hypothetical protein
MYWRLLFGVVILLFTIGVCQGAISECTTVERDGIFIQYCTELDDSLYVHGETAQINFMITNINADTIRLIYYNFGFRGQAEVWDTTGQMRWYAPEVVLPMGWTEDLAPGETVTQPYEWALRNMAGNLLPPGAYYVSVYSFIENFPNPPVGVDIDILDPTGIDEPIEPALWSTVKSLFR